MRIAVLCDPVDLDHSAGIPVYCRELCSRFFSDRNNEYVFFHFKRNPFFDGHENRIVPIPFRNGIVRSAYMVWRNFFVIPRLLRQERIDLVHEMNVIWPHVFDFFRPYTTVVTVHDVTPLKFPGTHGFLVRWWFRLFAGRSLRLADRIVANSHATKADVSTCFSIPENRISVTWLGPTTFDRSAATKIPALECKYILSVWTLEPRKNIRSLVRAFVRAKSSGALSGVKLVLTGRVGWKAESLFRELSLSAEYADDIVLTGFVSDDTLASLYAHASVFAYPSLYEWFGIPVLEAMGFGIPVITSNVSSLPEISGDAALLVDPSNVAELSDALVRLFSDVWLAERLRYAGLERSKGFSWETCATETTAAYSLAHASAWKRK